LGWPVGPIFKSQESKKKTRKPSMGFIWGRVKVVTILSSMVPAMLLRIVVISATLKQNVPGVQISSRCRREMKETICMSNGREGKGRGSKKCSWEINTKQKQ
jgi:hypothetical protein